MKNNFESCQIIQPTHHTLATGLEVMMIRTRLGDDEWAHANAGELIVEIVVVHAGLAVVGDHEDGNLKNKIIINIFGIL